MKTSTFGRALIEAFEGLFLKTYDDGEGVLTIGYGHTTAAGPPVVKKGMTITEAQADLILSNDLAAVEAAVAKLINKPMTQGQFDALVSFEFNTGDLLKSSIDDKINAGQADKAMATLLLYVHGANTGKALNGLVRRRTAEKMMFEGDITGSLKLAGAHVSSAPMPTAIVVDKRITLPPPPVPATKPALGFWATLRSIFTRKA